MQQMIGLEWIPETISGETDDEIHVSIMNKVEILVPELALVPDVRHKSAGLEAELGRHGVNVPLDKDALHIGVGVKWNDRSPQSILDGMNVADKIAATSAIALGQALGIRKVAAYVAMISDGRVKRPKSLFYSFRAVLQVATTKTGSGITLIQKEPFRSDRHGSLTQVRVHGGDGGESNSRMNTDWTTTRSSSRS